MQLRREKVNSRVAEGWKCIDSIDYDNFDVVKCLFLLGEMDVRISNAISGLNNSIAQNLIFLDSFYNYSGFSMVTLAPISRPYFLAALPRFTASSKKPVLEMRSRLAPTGTFP